METSERQRQRQRLAVADQVLQALRAKEFRSDTPASPHSHDRVILPALPDDAMGMLFDQLRAIDGLLHVAVPDEGRLVVFSMSPRRRPKHAAVNSAPVLDPCPVSRESQVIMVLRYLQMHGEPIICYEASPNVTIELVDTVGIPT